MDVSDDRRMKADRDKSRKLKRLVTDATPSGQANSHVHAYKASALTQQGHIG